MNKRRRFKAKKKRHVWRMWNNYNCTNPGTPRGQLAYRRLIWAIGWSWNWDGTRRVAAHHPTRRQL